MGVIAPSVQRHRDDGHKHAHKASLLLAVVTEGCLAHPLVAATILSVAAAAIAWFRLPSIARGTLWAEDGRDFLQDALNEGPVVPLFKPYAGYLQFLPRLIAGATVQLVPVAWYAQAMTAASCAAAGVMAGIVFVCAAQVVRPVPARMILAFLTVLTPLAPREVSGNTANIHSLVMWTMFWILLYRPKTRKGSWFLALVSAAGALTEIQTVFLAPLLLWRWRERSRLAVRAAYIMAAIAQLYVTVIWPRPANTAPKIGIPSVVYGFLINGALPLWLPQKGIGPALAWGGPVLAIGACLPLIAAFVVCLRFGAAEARLTAVGLASAAVLVYTVSVFENPHPYYRYATMSAAGLRSVWLTRYGVVPSMMLLALVPLAAGVLVTRGRPGTPHPRSHRYAASGIAILLLALLLVQFGPQDTRRSQGPAWQPQIDTLQQECARLPDNATIQVRETLGWHVNVECGRLD